MTATPLTTAASAALPAGTRRRGTPRRRQCSATGSTPRIGRMWPSSESSPMAIEFSMSPGLRMPVAERMPSAIGRSKAAPSLRSSAGARLIVMRSTGNSSPAFRIAARTRSRLSRTVESGRPTVVKDGRPGATSTSTKTSAASMPKTVAERTRASMAPVSGHARGPSMTQIRDGDSNQRRGLKSETGTQVRDGRQAPHR